MYSRYMLNHGSGSRRGQRLPPELPKDYSGTAFNKNNPGNADAAGALSYISEERARISSAAAPPKSETVTVKRTEPKTERYPELMTDTPDPDTFTFPRWDISDGASSALSLAPKRRGLRDNTAGQIKSVPDNVFNADKKAGADVFEPEELISPLFPVSGTGRKSTGGSYAGGAYTNSAEIKPFDRIGEALTEIPDIADSDAADLADKTDGRKQEKEKSPSGLLPELGGLFKNLDFSSSEILLIALIIYLLNSHADDEMVVILMILLVIGF